MAGEEELYRYDPRNRLTAYTQNGVTTMFQYDNAGNLLVDDKARYSYGNITLSESLTGQGLNNIDTSLV